jgi:hypothetical protein
MRKNKLNLSFLSFIVFTISFNSSSQLTIDKAINGGFVYDVKEEIKKSSYYSFQFKPFNLGFQANKYISLGAGAGVQIIDFYDKFSLASDFTYNYSNYNNDEGNYVPTLSTDPTLKTSGTKDVNLSLGYTFLRKSEKDTSQIWVARNTYSNILVKSITSYTAYIGYNLNSRYLDLGVRLNEAHHNLILGVKRRISIHNIYATDKYGDVLKSVENEVYADLLIRFASSPIDIYRTSYEEYLWGKTREENIPYIVSPNRRDEILSYRKIMPLGFRLGYRIGKRNSGFVWGGQVTMYPGRYTDMLNLLGVEFSATYRIFNKF